MGETLGASTVSLAPPPPCMFYPAMDVNRAYRVLGLPPDSSKEQVRQAYRDLTQVWHPDRFAHAERLQEKAQKNLKRINEAYETLRDYEPPPGGPRNSLASVTLSAIRDMGDMLRTTVTGRAAPVQRRRFEVLGLGEIERTGVYPTRRRRRRRRVVTAVVASVVLAVVAVVVVMWMR